MFCDACIFPWKLPHPFFVATCDMCSFTKIRGRINELKLSTGAADMATAGRARASWWPLFTASSPPQCNSPPVKEKERHLDYIPIHCIIHALLSHIKLYSPRAQERGVLMRAQYAKHWIKIKTLADTETQTREDNYTARSEKWTLLKTSHCMGTCSYSCLTRLTKSAAELRKGSPGRFCRCHFYSVSEMHRLTDF